jgi:hypothetical protein
MANGLCEIDFFAGFEADDGLFPMIGAAIVGATFTLGFAEDVGSAYAGDFLAEELFDRLLDVDLGRLWIDAEDVLVIALAEQCRFFAKANGLDDFV